MNYYINRLNELAKEASINDEVPIACLIIKDNQIIGEGVNKREKNNLIHGHAEINAINQASNKLGSWKLDNCIMYVSTEPCLMCYGAIKQSRIKKVYVASKQESSKKQSFNCYIEDDDQLIDYSYVNEESQNIIKEFFLRKRG